MASRRSSALVLAYALVAYGTFLVSALWSIGFMANASASPTTIDHATRRGGAAAALIDLVLLGLFAVHHSLMARSGAKRLLTRVLPRSAERSTYVLVASGLLLLLYWQWQPVGGSVWHVAGGAGRTLLWLGFALGWVVSVSSTFMIDHVDLLGLRQARAHGGEYVPPTFTERWLYAWIRHPLMLGFLIAFWSTPDMTGGHLLFAGAATGYIAVGIWLEERGLARELGPAYRDYLDRVPAVVPRRRPTGAPAALD
jgi:protein-S-isoprenylcysteine O-methyltransferase Ste14